MIAFSELGKYLLEHSDNGYNVIVGGKLFNEYSNHPNVRIYLPNLKIYSTAAGRYQILYKYWVYYKKTLKLPDFGHKSQDRIAIQLIKECHAIDDIALGNIKSAIKKCNSRWASLPGSGYNQHENKIENLLMAYNDYGGVLQE
jgi:muramidase (phage lysozyme)